MDGGLSMCAVRDGLGLMVRRRKRKGLVGFTQLEGKQVTELTAAATSRSLTPFPNRWAV